MKVLMFFIGDEEEKNKKIEELKKYDFEIGPSKQEHNFLIKNCDFYKKNFYEKKYAFCSDVWRVYKLSKVDEAIYIDFYTTICKNFSEYLNNINDNKTHIYYEVKNSVIWNGIIKSSNKLFFKKLFNFYTSIKKNAYTGPQIFTMFLIKEKILSINLKPRVDSIIIESSSFFDPRIENSPLKINSKASWNNNINNPMQLWFKKWNGEIKKKNFFYRIMMYKFYRITNFMLIKKYGER